MLKDILAANETAEIAEKEFAMLKKYFPNCFSASGEFDIEKFTKKLNTKVDITKEGYDLTFLGKSYAKLLVALETETIIKPDTEVNASKENAESQNIYLIGDNLDALKHLTKSYANRIKCIYIDPPYNTGKDDFLYTDKFCFSTEELVDKLGIDVEQAQRIIDMTSKGSSSHSAWLTFMYSRLLLARDLLAEKGVIFISIDDNEFANLKLLCDDVFDESNHLGTIIWKNATDNNPTNIAVEHEYILCYCANRNEIESEWKSTVSNIKTKIMIIEEELLKQYLNDEALLKEKYAEWYKNNKLFLGPLDGYKFIDKDGIYAGSRSVHNPGKEGYFYDIQHPVTNKPCKTPLMGYRFPELSMKELIAANKIIYGNDENKIIELKTYVKDYQDKLASVIELDGRSGANMIKELFDNEKVFTNPKPVDLLKHLFSFVVSEGDTILDIFGGSSTTAQAVMELNAQEKRNLRYILVQIVEACKTDSTAYKLGYHYIHQVGIERILRSAKKIKRESNGEVDLGFKLYELFTSQQKTLDKLDKFDPEGLFGDSTILKEFGSSTILNTWTVYDSHGFNPKICEIKLEEYIAYLCGQYLYLINDNMSDNAIQELIKRYYKDGNFNPDHIVIFGYSFGWSSLQMIKDNIKQLKYSDKKLDVQISVRY